MNHPNAYRWMQWIYLLTHRQEGQEVVFSAHYFEMNLYKVNNYNTSCPNELLNLNLFVVQPELTL